MTTKPQPPSRRAVVLSCDRWHLDFLGCYGNDWIETPNLQRLASQAVVFDRHFSACVDPELAVRAWWTGDTQLPQPTPGSPRDWRVALLSQSGVRTVLFVESSADSTAHAAPPFDEIIVVSGRDDLEARESETPFARLVVRVEQWLSENAADDRPTLLWLKCRGVPVPWLPPLGFADLYLEDFGIVVEPEASGAVALSSAAPQEFPEEEVIEFAEEQDLSSETERMPLDTRYAHALYAAYVSLLDRWIGRLLTSLEKRPEWRDALLVFAAATGQVLQNAGLDVDGDPAENDLPLRGELIHTPLILRLPDLCEGDREHAGTRRPALTQTIDLLPTLYDWLAVSAAGSMEGRSLLPVIRQHADTVHDSLLLGDGAGNFALRDDDFLYVEQSPATAGAEPSVRLYEKPFDRWDHSNIAEQSEQVVEAMNAALRERLSAGRTL